jgi:hypothetical protein
LPVGVEDRELKVAWGNFIEGLADWKLFGTMTFADPEGVPTYTHPGWGAAKRAFRVLKEQAQPVLGELAYVRMFEIKRNREVPHIHFLMGGTDDELRRMDLVDFGYRNWGITRVEKYEPAKGAAFYLCKYVTKQLADIEFSCNLGQVKGI